MFLYDAHAPFIPKCLAWMALAPTSLALDLSRPLAPLGYTAPKDYTAPKGTLMWGGGYL